jgi:hypothetical protein
MRTLMLGLVAALLVLPADAQTARKKPRPESEQHRSQVAKRLHPRRAPGPVAPASRVTPEPLYDTEKAMR